MKKLLLCASAVLLSILPSNAQLLNQAKDMSLDFKDMNNTYFFASELTSFDAAKGEGLVKWDRYALSPRQAFNVTTIAMDKIITKDFPSAYYNDPELSIKIDVIDDNTFRVRMLTSEFAPVLPDELMLDGEPSTVANPNVEVLEDRVVYKTSAGSLTIEKKPWRLVLRDANGKVLTRTRAMEDNEVTQVKIQPFGFVKRNVDDNRRSVEPVFSLFAGERIYGCGESPTSLNKAGQKVKLFVTDPQGPETDEMYKPVPFWFSNRGYGLFFHTSAPMTCDFGASYVGAQRLYMGDEALDLFIFLGEPKQILDEYTNLVGKSPVPPLWSFGTWMSRITYQSEAETREVAKQLRANRIPADVIHLDTGWFGIDWQCDYKFAPDRFNNAKQMISDLLDDGFHISLWQLPYFTPQNKLYKEIVEKGLAVKNEAGALPYDDAVLDFTNPATVKWYQDHLRSLLEMGVGAIKVDFGEGAPYNARYSNGRSGLYEHNLYPVRYNKAVAEITKEVKGEHIIWARSAWAGSQRYPSHWGGDAANTNEAMLSTLHAGMSFGLSGFSYWSHDIGGFVKSTPEDLYRRWLPFGFLTSHTRSHGDSPTEPWLYNEEFTAYYRECAEMKYKLMPYIVEQAQICSSKGLPMVRAMFVEYPDDPTAWLVEDQYLFGSDILVAPIFEGDDTYHRELSKGGPVTRPQSRPTTGLQTYTRNVYLPGGNWVDYQTGKVYKQGWNQIATERLECVILVRQGAVIPMAKVAQSTKDIDWNSITKKKF